MSDLKFTVKYRVPTYIIYQALTDQSLISKYTQSTIKFEAKVGSEFSLYDGTITGDIKELVENKKIVESWKFNNWDASAELKLTINEKKGNECAVEVSLKNIPSRDSFKKTIEHDNIKSGFMSMIFDRISTWLGYPQNKDESDEESED